MSRDKLFLAFGITCFLTVVAVVSCAQSNRDDRDAFRAGGLDDVSVWDDSTNGVGCYSLRYDNISCVKVHP